MSRPIRVGVIGCGAAAQALHLPTLTNLDEFEVVAVTDQVPERARAAAAEFGTSTAPTLTALAAQAEVVAVLTRAHEDLVAEVLESGTHVFSEKPLSLDPVLGDQLRARAHREGLMLRVGAMRAHDPAATALVQAIGRGPRNGVLTKLDGTDPVARTPFHTLTTTPAAAERPRYPQTLTRAAQRRALEILAWEGYHLLTLAALATTPPRTAHACVLDDDGRVVHATLTDVHGALITLTVGPATAGVYIDHARLSADKSAAIDFTGPYPPGPGKAPHPAFAALWRDIAHQLASGQHPVDTLSADVEELAAALAALAT